MNTSEGEMRQCSIPVDALCGRQRRELRSLGKTGGKKSKVEEAEIQERREATWSIPVEGMSLPLTDSGDQRRNDQGGAQGLGAGVLSGRRARTTTILTPEDTGTGTRKGKTPREKMREGKERERCILEVLPPIGRIPRRGAAEGFFKCLNLKLREAKFN